MRRGSAIFAVVVATSLAWYGASHLTEATQGAGIIALACFVAIGARLMQASAHERRIEEHLHGLKAAPPAAQPPVITARNIDHVARRFGVTERT